MKIAFLGLGHRGGPMALNLHRAGHDVVVIAVSASAAVQGAEAVISMLPASQHVEVLYLGNGEGGLLQQLPAGALTFMMGGEAADLERATPLLKATGQNIFRAGAHGAGTTAKICNNMLLGDPMIGTSEALALGVANGLVPKVLSEIMLCSSGGNWALEKYNPMPGVMENARTSKNYAGGFGTDLMLKDLGLARANATAATPGCGSGFDGHHVVRLAHQK